MGADNEKENSSAFDNNSSNKWTNYDEVKKKIKLKKQVKIQERENTFDILSNRMPHVW